MYDRAVYSYFFASKSRSKRTRSDQFPPHYHDPEALLPCCMAGVLGLAHFSHNVEAEESFMVMTRADLDRALVKPDNLAPLLICPVFCA